MSDPAEQPETAAGATVESPSGRRPTRWLRGGVVALVGGFAAFCLMAYEHHFRHSALLGSIACLIATWGLLDTIGSFDDAGDDVRSRVPINGLLPRLGELVASLAALLAALTLAVAGVLPKPILSGAVLVTGTFLWVTTALFRTARALGGWRSPDGEDRPLFERYGFWLVALIALTYLPTLGSFSLSDPWETHYGEVAREMLARDDWISLWWAQDGWFWSKPIFDFWAQGLSFALLGVKYQPDEMLRAVAHGRLPQPEWAARLPIFVVTLLGAYFLYRATARVWNRRAGFIAGLALTTMPYWFLISHQTMTDMPYVGTLAAGLCLVLLGFVSDPDERVPVYEIALRRTTFRVSIFHVLAGAVVLISLPQILYLASRNLTLHLSEGLYGFRFHADEFFAGSGMGNCGLPGNRGCAPTDPVNKTFWPLHGAVVWSLLLGVFLWLNRDERRLSRLAFQAGWLFIVLAVMAKGAPGFAIPVAAVGGFILSTRRWKDLQRIEIGAFALLIGCVVLPWYVQMYMRHGPPFIDRLIMHDMYKRAFVHVHDTNQGDDTSFRYYVWQLGYGLFPWTGLSAAALVAWLKRPDHTRDQRGDAAVFMAMWFLSTFGMFTITLTKFHHYIFPLVPATAVLTGVLVDRLLGPASPARDGKAAHYLGFMAAGLLLLVYGLLRLSPHSLLGLELESASKPLAYACITFGMVFVAGAVLRFGRRASELGAVEEVATTATSARALHERAIAGMLGVVAVIPLLLSGRDLVVSNEGDVNASVRLMQLFTYNYKRPWPDHLDFTGAFLAFTVAAGAALLMLTVTRLRPHAVAAFSIVSVIFCAWGVNVYLVQAAPHWGQRETILAYYKHRASPDEPIVAYQMNWKGENFYTGNRVPAFVSSGQKFKEWISEQKDKGVRVVYFTTEHGRIGSLKRELDNPSNFKVLTDERLNNKFALARVEL